MQCICATQNFQLRANAEKEKAITVKLIDSSVEWIELEPPRAGQ